MCNAMDVIDGQIEDLRKQLYELQRRIEKMERASNAIYLKYLDMMAEPEDVRDRRVIEMWDEALKNL